MLITWWFWFVFWIEVWIGNHKAHFLTSWTWQCCDFKLFFLQEALVDLPIMRAWLNFFVCSFVIYEIVFERFISMPFVLWAKIVGISWSRLYCIRNFNIWSCDTYDQYRIIGSTMVNGIQVELGRMNHQCVWISIIWWWVGIEHVRNYQVKDEWWLSLPSEGTMTCDESHPIIYPIMCPPWLEWVLQGPKHMDKL